MKVSLWLEDAIAAGALVAVLVVAPQVVLALDNPQPAPKPADPKYAHIVAAVLTRPSVITVDGEVAASCRPIRRKQQ